ncbi:MAG: hypothetical protein QG574_5399 [Cyanobacteriota bacterium erpe_2018_sw_21hr_WHONDRS-SW48-000092_B_bin.40]|nr:hypothetical protein [Cyanobacteriota bacterium erpe_2018_sw_21hr_WHONDRS-SW48-000092_B_bin.40]
MPIDLPQLLFTRPEVAEVRYLADRNNSLIAKSKPLQPLKRKYPSCYDGEVNYRAHRVMVVGGNEYQIAPLKTMQLPKYWWRYLPASLGSSENYHFVFSPRGDRETTITLERTFKDRESDVCHQLLETLKAPPHKIGEDECKLLNLTYSDFQHIETADLNGRRVVTGEGASCRANLFYLMLFHSQSEPYGCGSIRFRATPEKYKQYIKAVKASFQSIEWETTANKSN